MLILLLYAKDIKVTDMSALGPLLLSIFLYLVDFLGLKLSYMRGKFEIPNRSSPMNI